MTYIAPILRRIFDAGWLPLPWGVKDSHGAPRFDMDRLREAFAAMGIRALWESVSPCPCGGDRAAGIGCALCGGDGWYAHRSQIIRTIATSAIKNWEPVPLTRINPAEPGSIMLTVRGEHAPVPKDRITLLDSFIRLSLLERRTATEAEPIEVLRYPVAVQTIETMEEGESLAVAGEVEDVEVGVIELRGQKADGTAASAALVEGTDFEVTDDGYLDWTKGDALGTAPALGSLYSLYYTAHPVYRVMEHTHAVRESRTRTKTTTDSPLHLPVQFQARLEWLVEAL